MASCECLPREMPAEGRIPRTVLYVLAILITATNSGGLILGVGPFSSRLIQEGYVLDEQVDVIFTGAFQIMTWGSILAVHLENCLGPRLTAMLGACVEVAGHATIATLPKPANPYRVMTAFGLVGWGGNQIFFTCFQFARLFPDNIGIADGGLTGAWSLAGAAFLVLNVPGLTIKRVFTIMACLSTAAFLACLVLWPDTKYTGRERVSLSCPTCAHAKNVFATDMYQGHLRSILNFRYLLYALTFSWSCLVSTYVSGSLIIYQSTGCMGDFYMKWAYPLIVNSQFLLTGSVGHMIDRKGFAAISLMLILTCLLSLLCLSATHSNLAAWSNLALINTTMSIQYTIEFAFLHRGLPEEAFHFGLIATLTTQGLVAFIANPGLTPNPWGEDYVPPALIIAAVGLPCFAWPILEWRYYTHDARASPMIGEGHDSVPPILSMQ